MTRAIPVPTPYVKKVPIIRQIPVPIPNKKSVADKKIVNETNVKIVGLAKTKKESEEEQGCPNCAPKAHNEDDCVDPTHNHLQHFDYNSLGYNGNSNSQGQLLTQADYDNYMWFKQQYEADQNKNIKYTTSFAGNSWGNSAFN